MTKTDRRQFLDEIIMNNKDKLHRGALTERIKSLKHYFKEKEQVTDGIDEVFGDRKRAYDHSMANLFRKYSIDHDDLYSDLDRLWASSKKRAIGKHIFFKPEIYTLLNPPILTANVLVSGFFAKRLSDIFVSVWDDYRQYSYEFAVSYTKTLINEEK